MSPAAALPTTWNEVERRIQAGRDDQTEFTPSACDPSLIGRTICGFANSAGGLLVLGASDSGEILGIEEDPAEVGAWLDDLLDTGFTEMIPAERGRRRCADRWVHWIATPRLRALGGIRFESRFWIRNNRVTVEPPYYALRELMGPFPHAGMDGRLIRDARPNDLDPEVVRSFLLRSSRFARLGRPSDLERPLEILRATWLLDGRCFVSLSGLLAFGRSPQAFRQTRNFTVRCTAYGGSERDWDVRLSSEIEGRFDQQVHGALRWFRRVVPTIHSRDECGDADSILPPTVLCEILSNAVAHRDYSIPDRNIRLEVFEDRVEVTNPGVLPDTATLASLEDGGWQRVRNRVAFEALGVAGMTFDRGLGVGRIRRAMRAFNGTTPDVENDIANGEVRVTLRLRGEDICR